jgi:hypothetical protein
LIDASAVLEESKGENRVLQSLPPKRSQIGAEATGIVFFKSSNDGEPENATLAIVNNLMIEIVRKAAVDGSKVAVA